LLILEGVWIVGIEEVWLVRGRKQRDERSDWDETEVQKDDVDICSIYVR
jgi:hypothetical protein